MKESHRKGLASHPAPESCVVRRAAEREALTGAHAGRVWSCEITISSRVPTVWINRKAISAVAPSRATEELCAVRDPGMYGYSTRENRETSGMPIAGRIVRRWAGQ